jgi:hypothetical protein
MSSKEGPSKARERGVVSGSTAEADCRQAWDECAKAAQCGDYDRAERWYHQAITLGCDVAAHSPKRNVQPGTARSLASR